MTRLSEHKTKTGTPRRRTPAALGMVVLVDIYMFEQDDAGDWYRSGRDGSGRRLITCTESRLLAALIRARERLAKVQAVCPLRVSPQSLATLLRTLADAAEQADNGCKYGYYSKKAACARTMAKKLEAR